VAAASKWAECRVAHQKRTVAAIDRTAPGLLVINEVRHTRFGSSNRCREGPGLTAGALAVGLWRAPWGLSGGPQ